MSRAGRIVSRATALALGGLLAAAPARAQGVSLDLGVLAREGRDASELRGGVRLPLTGPLGADLRILLIRDRDPDSTALWGAGGDLTLFRDGRGPYVVAGLDGGLVRRGPRDLWGSWSAGVGYELRPLSFLALGVEGRWRELSVGRNGASLSARLSVLVGGRRGPSRESGAPPASSPSPAEGAPGPQPLATALPAGGATSERAALAGVIVATARDAMGRRYQFGGTGQGEDEGFDCSGLIQYAFQQHGIALPRTSRDQAQAGRAMPRDPAALEPGDLLTFATRGTRVSHVGLYVGDGRFIHSATGGVQESVLSPDDPYGKWWYARWVGVRRIIPD